MVREKLAKEVQLGRMVGHFEDSPLAFENFPIRSGPKEGGGQISHDSSIRPSLLLGVFSHSGDDGAVGGHVGG